jgi:hypothetical protein
MGHWQLPQFLGFQTPAGDVLWTPESNTFEYFGGRVSIRGLVGQARLPSGAAMTSGFYDVGIMRVPKEAD